MFRFNADKYDYWPIYESIIKYYPIGVQKEDRGCFYTYPGIKKLQAIIADRIHNESNFKSEWLDFTAEVSRLMNLTLWDTTYSQDPCFSAFLILNTENEGTFTRTKELHFYVSLLGPFYTVIGEDNNKVTEDERTYWTTNCLIIAPENQFKEGFDLLCSKIEERFKGYRFVPFHIYDQIIDGLEIMYDYILINKNKIFSALFNDRVDLECRKSGDEYFKADDWIREGWVDDGSRWVAYAPLSAYPKNI